MTVQMGGKTGAPAGSITIFDADLNSIGSWNLGPNADNSACEMLSIKHACHVCIVTYQPQVSCLCGTVSVWQVLLRLDRL